ncbi:MAG: methyltransferase domain-containing protein [Desulfurococcales archaeon]|nr:methyltransferase domain-containing protein [Desulfurococcales archaeon]
MGDESVREKYNATAETYDSIYKAEQFEKYMVLLSKLRPQGIVLDAGCGTGLFAEYLAPLGYFNSSIKLYVCLDYSRRMLDIASRRLSRVCPEKCITIEGDIENIPLRNSSVDWSFSFTVVDLAESKNMAVSELDRVSRRGFVVSFLKKLPYKDIFLDTLKYLGSSSKDVILYKPKAPNKS